MKNFDVYFEIYGKKMKATIMAESESEAKELLKNKIIFHKIEPKKDAFQEFVDIVEGMTNILNGKQNTPNK